MTPVIFQDGRTQHKRQNTVYPLPDLEAVNPSELKALTVALRELFRAATCEGASQRRPLLQYLFRKGASFDHQSCSEEDGVSRRRRKKPARAPGKPNRRGLGELARA